MDYVIKDIAAIVPYIPIGLIWAILIVFGWSTWVKIRGGQISTFRGLVVYLFSTYLIVILFVAFFSREPGSRDKLALVPFATWGTTAKEHAFVIENIIMFVPFGILFPMLGERVGKFRICVLAAFLSSMFLEVLQVITKRGFGQTDDVLTNVLGACMGYGVYCFLKGIKHAVDFS